MISNLWVGVILAAGIGYRMRSSTPKALHPLCGRTLIEQTVRTLREAGIERIVIVASPLLSSNPQLLQIINGDIGEGVTVAIQTEPRGTGHALLSASDAASQTTHILVANADMPLVTADTVRSMLTTHTDLNLSITLSGPYTPPTPPTTPYL